jgi:DNA invertase Pin-like site-specific DNA recombinase
MANRVVRCAVYTRKSTEEGLEQEFNTLHAQREACAACILSQKHEGWQLLPEFYDDGGYSGGNMERPGLKQLMADVESGRVDVIVVYKVDRLSRSLADFAKIVEVLDRVGSSFVSVTQAFNTTTSMGPLTLNVLLSFAQFEREVTGERIRDKVAASKKKGMWMGGPVPLGYDVKDRKLIINPAEAATVRHIFERYLALRSGPQLVDELMASGIRTKLRAFKDGRQVGGVPFTVGPLSHLLNNPVYVGEVRHKGTNYPGQHEPIISQELWDEVQSSLASNRVNRRIGGWGRAPSLLTGMLFDQTGRLMTPTSSAKAARRYRYYTSRARTGEMLSAREKAKIPAGELERVVIEQLLNWLERCGGTNLKGTSEEIDEQCVASNIFAKRLAAGTFHELRGELLSRNARIDLMTESIKISFDEAKPSGAVHRACLELKSELVDRGSDLKLMIAPDTGQQQRDPDPVLVKLIVHAFAARESLLSGTADTITSEYSLLHRSRLARLSYLAPDIISAIVAGNHPPALHGRRLLRAANLPLDWDGQRRLLGFA